MPSPSTRPRRRPPGRDTPATEKHIELRWYPVALPGAWRLEPFVITSFNINSGALTLLHRGHLLRVFSPGTWGDLVVIGEAPLTDERPEG